MAALTNGGGLSTQPWGVPGHSPTVVHQGKCQAGFNDVIVIDLRHMGMPAWVVTLASCPAHTLTA